MSTSHKNKMLSYGIVEQVHVCDLSFHMKLYICAPNLNKKLHLSGQG